MQHQRRAHVKFQEIDLPVNPMELVGLYYIGPFPADRNGNRYRRTAICYLTGWAEAFPVRTENTEDLIEVFEREFIPRHGHPERVICDNGPSFRSNAWGKFLSDRWIKRVLTTPVHPQGNGRVERFHRTFKGMLRKLVNNQPIRWAQHVGQALAAHIHSVNEVTGFTPFFLLYGRQARVPMEEMLRTDRTDIFGDRLHDQRAAFRAARERATEARSYNRARGDARANVATSLRVGDRVTVKYEGGANPPPFVATRKPEWTVTKVRGTTHWVLHQPSGVTKRLHREKLSIVDPMIDWGLQTLPPGRNRTGVDPRKKLVEGGDIVRSQVPATEVRTGAETRKVTVPTQGPNHSAPNSGGVMTRAQRRRDLKCD